MKSPDKTQLNLCVDHSTDQQFRQLAMAAGYGKRPSPFLGDLLKLHTGNFQALDQRLKQLLKENPELLQSREQRFFAELLMQTLQAALAGEAPANPSPQP